MRLQLLGQPKSGTTWLETIVFALARHCLSASDCRVAGVLDQRANRSFTLVHSGGQRLCFASPVEWRRGKHLFPPTGFGHRECTHANAWLSPYAASLPCGLSKEGLGSTQLLACARRCGAASTVTRINLIF